MKKMWITFGELIIGDHIQPSDVPYEVLEVSYHHERVWITIRSLWAERMPGFEINRDPRVEVLWINSDTDEIPL